MTEREFVVQTERLCNLYAKTLNDEQKRFWYESLKPYSVEKYRDAVSTYSRSNRFMPTIADILETIKNNPQNMEVSERVPCKTCNGTGYILYYKKYGGMEYEYACQCYCENGKRVTYDGRHDNPPCDYYLPSANEIFLDRSVGDA